jgi:hypothetical protein
VPILVKNKSLKLLSWSSYIIKCERYEINCMCIKAKWLLICIMTIVDILRCAYGYALTFSYAVDRCGYLNQQVSLVLYLSIVR